MSCSTVVLPVRLKNRNSTLNLSLNAPKPIQLATFSNLLENSLMARCPRCSKFFVDESRVMKHLNQPVSACLSYHEEVKRMNKALAASRNRDHPEDFQRPVQEFMQHPEPISDGVVLDNRDSESNMNIDLDNINNHSLHSSSNSPFVEMFPGAGQIFGRGETSDVPARLGLKAAAKARL